MLNIRVRGLGAGTTEFDLVSDESREWKYLSNSMQICAPNSPNYCIEICQFKFLVTIVMLELGPVERRRSTRESYQLLGQITVIDWPASSVVQTTGEQSNAAQHIGPTRG